MICLLLSCGRSEEAFPAPESEWTPLFPDEGLGEWERVEFGGAGELALADGILRMEQGAELTGVVWRGALPEVPYEIELEGRRLMGSDFFCGLTVPVGGEGRAVTLILGGWGGGHVGISSIDGLDASENETTSYLHFEDERWYRVRMVVEEDRIGAWIDDEMIIDVSVAGRELSLRPGDISECAPLGLATFQTVGEIRGIRWRGRPE